MLYINPIIGFSFMLWEQFSGGSINLFPGLFMGTGISTYNISPWIVNLVFNIVLSILLIFLSANKINPLRIRRRTLFSSSKKSLNNIQYKKTKR